MAEEIVWCTLTDSACIFEAAYHWQTLLSALIALSAALWAGRILTSQIRQADRQEAERRDRRHTAARATLPLTLSALSNYTLVMVDRLKIFHQLLQQREDDVADLKLDPPSPPSDVIPTIERMIEATDKQNVVTLLRKMLSELQILHSRAEEMSRSRLGDRHGIPHNIETYILQCAVIYAQAAAMFNFARFESEDTEAAADWPGVYNAFLIMDVHEQRFPGLYQLCQGLEAEHVSPES